MLLRFLETNMRYAQQKPATMKSKSTYVYPNIMLTDQFEILRS